MDRREAGEQVHRHRSAWLTERGAVESVRWHSPAHDRRLRCYEGGDACSAGAHRACAWRDTEQPRRTPRPATQGSPARRTGRPDTSCCAGTSAHMGWRKLLVRPERKRPRDRAERVPEAPRDATRHHDQDGLAGPTTIATSFQLRGFWGSTRGRWSFQSTTSQAVTYDLQGPAQLAARNAADRAVARPDCGT